MKEHIETLRSMIANPHRSSLASDRELAALQFSLETLEQKQETELLPCPFCGNDAVLFSQPDEQGNIICCLLGHAPMRSIEGWNTRADSVNRKAIFDEGRRSVVFSPHSAYRDQLRQMICEGEFDFTKILEELE